MTGQSTATIQCGWISLTGRATSSAARNLQIVCSKCVQFGKRIRKKFVVTTIALEQTLTSFVR